MKEYLSCVVQLEQKKYELRSLLNIVCSKKKEYEKQYIQDEISYEDQKKRSYHDFNVWEFVKIFFGCGFSLFVCFVGIGLVLCIFSKTIRNADIKGIRPFLIILLVIDFFVAIKGADEGVSKRVAKEMNKEIYEEVELENKEIREKNKIVRFNKEKHLPVYNREYEILYAQYKEVQTNLEKLYALNIIFPKYRSLVPICSFYEYLSSGRCESLEGYEGAYNIYETEIRQNVIIGKLDIVISKLNMIIDNQYVLYTKLNETNKNISQMCNSISNQLGSIEDSSFITAYNSKITAENMEFIKWFSIFKERNRIENT